jgi:hypothetical protein
MSKLLSAVLLSAGRATPELLSFPLKCLAVLQKGARVSAGDASRFSRPAFSSV